MRTFAVVQLYTSIHRNEQLVNPLPLGNYPARSFTSAINKAAKDWKLPVAMLGASLAQDDSHKRPKPTKYYYFNEGHTIYYGNDADFTFFKSMDRYPYKEVEQEVARLNKAAKLVAPVDDDFTDEE